MHILNVIQKIILIKISYCRYYQPETNMADLSLGKCVNDLSAKLNTFPSQI